MTIDNGNGKKKLIIDDFQIEKIMNAVTGAMPEERRAELDKKSQEIIDRIIDETTSGMFQALQDVMSRPEYKDLTQEQLFARDENGKRIYDQVKQEATELLATKQINVTGRETTALYQSTTKAEHALFNPTVYQSEYAKDGRLDALPISAESSNSKDVITTFVSIDYESENEDIVISRPLKPHEADVLYASYTLLLSGYITQTPAMIWHAMGNTKRCFSEDKTLIVEAVDHMFPAFVTINNAQEAAAYKYDDVSDISYHLLPIKKERRLKANNGKPIDGAFTYTALPELLQYAVDRKNFTTTDKRIANPPIRRSDLNDTIEYYIRHLYLRGLLSKGVKWETLYSQIGIADKASIYKTRAKKTAIQLLDFYQKEGFIKSYSLEKESMFSAKYSKKNEALNRTLNFDLDKLRIDIAKANTREKKKRLVSRK